MAVDEALLECVAGWKQPVLRFYGWSEPAATFGYSQHYADVARWTALRPLIRRPTGGGLVPHDADWTYSLAFPPGHPWYELKAVESYRAAHQWVTRLSPPWACDPTCSAAARLAAPGQCFAGAENSTFCSGRKDCRGCATSDPKRTADPGIRSAPRYGRAKRSDWQRAMLQTGPGTDQIPWETFPADDRFRERVELLVAEKYSRDAYNQRR